jgi:hypothetical protein
MKGIKYQVNGRQYYIKFKYFNQRIVKCYLTDEDLQMIFIGIAKLNLDEGDVWNQKEGEDWALGRALEKRTNFIVDLKIKIMMDLDTQDLVDAGAIKDKITREQNKFIAKQEKLLKKEFMDKIAKENG